MQIWEEENNWTEQTDTEADTFVECFKLLVSQKKNVCVCVCVCRWVGACMRACRRACVRACVCVCVYVCKCVCVYIVIVKYSLYLSGF